MDDLESSSEDIAARRLEAMRSTIIARYEEELRRTGSPIIGNETALHQARQNAASTLEYVISVLPGRTTAENRITNLAEQIGIARASHGILPEESIRAAEVLFDILMKSVEDAAAGEDNSLSVIGTSARAVNNFMMSRIRAASVNLFQPAGQAAS